MPQWVPYGPSSPWLIVVASVDLWNFCGGFVEVLWRIRGGFVAVSVLWRVCGGSVAYDGIVVI